MILLLFLAISQIDRFERCPEARSPGNHEARKRKMDPNILDANFEYRLRYLSSFLAFDLKIANFCFDP